MTEYTVLTTRNDRDYYTTIVRDSDGNQLSLSDPAMQNLKYHLTREFHEKFMKRFISKNIETKVEI